MSTAAESKPRRRRLFVPLLLLLTFCVVVALVAAAAVRGEWADNTVKNPLSVDESAVTQLYQKPNGNVVVRCAIMVEAPPKQVWGVVKGYARHGEFIPNVSKLEATPQKDGRMLVSGVVHSRLGGEWKFESLIRHAESPEKGEYAATWTERDVDAFKLNRGSWSVTPTEKTQQQSLLVCTLQLELKECPNFIVRDLLLFQLPEVVQAMRDEAVRRKPG